MASLPSQTHFSMPGNFIIEKFPRPGNEAGSSLKEKCGAINKIREKAFGTITNKRNPPCYLIGLSRRRHEIIQIKC